MAVLADLLRHGSTTNLSSPFTLISSNVAATPPNNTYQQTIGPNGSGYYRIEAK